MSVRIGFFLLFCVILFSGCSGDGLADNKEQKNEKTEISSAFSSGWESRDLGLALPESYLKIVGLDQVDGIQNLLYWDYFFGSHNKEEWGKFHKIQQISNGVLEIFYVSKNDHQVVFEGTGNLFSLKEYNARGEEKNHYLLERGVLDAESDFSTFLKHAFTGSVCFGELSNNARIFDQNTHETHFLEYGAEPITGQTWLAYFGLENNREHQEKKFFAYQLGTWENDFSGERQCKRGEELVFYKSGSPYYYSLRNLKFALGELNPLGLLSRIVLNIK